MVSNGECSETMVWYITKSNDVVGCSRLYDNDATPATGGKKNDMQGNGSLKKITKKREGVGGRRKLELSIWLSLLLNNDNPGNLVTFVISRPFELELQQATNRTGQCHKIALIVKLHKYPIQGTRMNTHFQDNITLQALRHRST